MALFKKTGDDGQSDKASVPRVGRSRPARLNNASVIASTQTFQGSQLTTEGLIIEGYLECTTAHHQKYLTVGESGRVRADIHANTVTIMGQLVGDIYSNGMVSLANGSDVKGDIFCARVFIEEGARFEGKIDMEEAPNATATPKDPM
jgi:cytoskeletal protein CcmA (bactofilin family)